MNEILNKHLEKLPGRKIEMGSKVYEAILHAMSEYADYIRQIDSDEIDRMFKQLGNQIDELNEELEGAYSLRAAYNFILFNEWGKKINHLGKDIVKYNVQKSWRHSDGELCFGGGWFIIVAELPTGQISNHYKAEYWDLAKVPTVKQINIEYDGHTTEDVLNRLTKFIEDY